MSVLITALDGTTVHTDPNAQLLSTWAYERHCRDCATCRREETWCDQGRLLLMATAPRIDLPGYPPV